MSLFPFPKLKFQAMVTDHTECIDCIRAKNVDVVRLWKDFHLQQKHDMIIDAYLNHACVPNFTLTN